MDTTNTNRDVAVVLVTGASGYIATHIVKRLLENGEYKVRGTVRSTKNPEKIRPLRELVKDPKYPLELVEADLLKEEGWIEAVKGCTYVLHTASPFPVGNPENEDDLIKPALEGTLKVLKACSSAGGVRRLVLTSSCVAVATMGPANEDIKTEKDWPDLSVAPAYDKSKALAEKAGWDYTKDHPKDFELSVVNPSLVIGPPLTEVMSTSQNFPKSLLENLMPKPPNMQMPMVDVRDVVTAHLQAMVLPEAVNNRHMLVTDNVWFKDFAKILADEFNSQGYNVPAECDPSDPAMSMGNLQGIRMRTVLGISKPITVKQSTIDMAYNMIESGKIKKADKYKGPPSA